MDNRLETIRSARRSMRLVAILAGLLSVAASSLAMAQGQEKREPKWASGDEFQRQLETKVGLAWSSEPLRQKLNNLAENLRIAIWLDRRIDPSQEPEFSLSEMPLRRVFDLLATRLNAGVCTIGPVVYLGPKSTAARLATVAALRNDEAARLPPEARARFARVQPWQWESLTTPRELLDQLASDGNVRFLGRDQIPHDLWAAADLPPLSFADRLTLVLAGFELTFQFDEQGKSVKIIPMPEQPRLVRSYSVQSDPQRLISQLQQAVPEAQLKREGPRVVVTGRAEDHDVISRLLKGEKVRTTTVGPARTVYSMQGPSALGTVLKTLEVQAQLKIALDPLAESKLRDRVSFSVKEASLEELITAVLKDTGLQFELSGKELRVFAAK